MSYYDMTADMYREEPAGTPGWQMAPVPGWGINPLRAGPPRVGIGDMFERGSIPGEDDFLPRWAPIGAVDYNETTWGHVALAAAGGISLGILFGYAWWQGPKR